MPEAHPSTLSGAFNRPFAEQIAFWRGKLGNLVPTDRWDDLVGAAHDRAFMVAGAQNAELLADLAAAVDRAIAEGTSLETFRRDFRSIVERNGWHGWTGEGSRGGEAWRTRVIYRTNARTSYAAGRFAQLTAGNYSLWVYHHGNSKEPRLNHLSWDGMAIAPEHRFWTIYYPPSGWGCSCYVTGARSERAARRQGGDPSRQLPEGWDQPDPRTGLPSGIQRGWGYAPGASVAGDVAAIAGRIGSWDYRIGKAFMESVPDSIRDELARGYRQLPSVAADARAYAERHWDAAEPENYRTLGLLTGEQSAPIAARGLNAGRIDFSLTANEIAHVRRSHGDDAIERAQGLRAVTPDDFARLPQLLNSGVPRYVGLSQGHRQPVFEITVEIDGEVYVTRWEYWARRRTLALLSFFIRTGKRS